jgi:uncharacterized membrane protein
MYVLLFTIMIAADFITSLDQASFLSRVMYCFTTSVILRE